MSHPFTTLYRDYMAREKKAKEEVALCKFLNAKEIAENAERIKHNARLKVINNAALERNRIVRAKYESDKRQHEKARENYRALGMPLNTAGPRPRLNVEPPIPYMPQLPLPHPAPKWATDMVQMESITRAALNHRVPSEWTTVLKHVADINCRTRAACLIWWDFFASMDVIHRCKTFDSYITAPHVDVQDDDLCLALTVCGYTAKMAKKRIMMIELVGGAE